MSIQTDIASLRFKINELQQKVISTGNAALQDQINVLSDELNTLADSVYAAIDVANLLQETIDTSVLQLINVSGSESIAGTTLNLSGSGITFSSSAASQTITISSSALINPVTSLTISAGPGGAANRGIFMSGSGYLDASGITYTNTFPGTSGLWPQVANKTYKSYSDGTWVPTVDTLAGLTGTRNWNVSAGRGGGFVKNGKHIFLYGRWQGAGYTGVAPTTDALYLMLPNITSTTVADTFAGIIACGLWTTVTTNLSIVARVVDGSYIAPLYKITSAGVQTPLIGSDFSGTSSIEFSGHLMYNIP
jgi:hypothetical protein